GEVVSVFGAHLGVLDAHEAVLEVPGALKAVNVQHIAVVVVKIIVDHGLRVADRRKRVETGWIVQGPANSIRPSKDTAGLHLAEVCYWKTILVVNDAGGLAEHVTHAVVAVVDLAIVADRLAGQVEGV